MDSGFIPHVDHDPDSSMDLHGISCSCGAIVNKPKVNFSHFKNEGGYYYVFKGGHEFEFIHIWVLECITVFHKLTYYNVSVWNCCGCYCYNNKHETHQ